MELGIKTCYIMNKVPRFRNKINFGSYGEEYSDFKNNIKTMAWTVPWLGLTRFWHPGPVIAMSAPNRRYDL
jgi:hypothetical protein